MESLFLYLAKSSGLIAVFYLSYYFMVRKETFFNSNRWFLLGGLFTAVLLPFFIIKKVIWIEQPKVNLQNLALYSPQNVVQNQEVPIVEVIDWAQLLWVSYSIICCVFVVKIMVNLLSLYQLLYKKQIVKSQSFKLVDINENIAPFSFFNYIVFNSRLYTKEELESILMHEKIHSKEKHSIDVLIAKVFCIVFWFNPFMWLYKKAIIQNLEYIADQKAIQQLEDRKTYQHALLKVISHQNCLSITNNFYQSLIKKRIVMLNKNQSNKSKSWKYVLVLPVLVTFFFLFQIKTIAQEHTISTIIGAKTSDEVRLCIDKNSSEEQLKRESKKLKEEHGVTLKYSKVKRNAKGEITGIKVEYKDKEGNKGVSQVNGNEPINPILFYKNNSSIGFGKSNSYSNNSYSTGGYANLIDLSDLSDDEDAMSYHFDFNIPEIPEVTEYPEIAEAIEAPEYPEFPKNLFGNTETQTIIQKDGEKPIIIVNGKVIEGNLDILDKKQIEELKNATIIESNGKKQRIIVNGKDVGKIRAEALENARNQIKKMRPEMRARVQRDIERAKKQVERAASEMSEDREKTEEQIAQMQNDKQEMEQARQEMMQAKAEMLQAKAEMEAAKAELEKAKANLKTKK